MLYFGKAKKKYTREQWESISADCAPPGVYTPNMTSEYADMWRAKQVGGKNPRIEIRKSLNDANIVLIVYADGSLQLSANGKMRMNATQAQEFLEAIAEAKEILNNDANKH